jgi:hypothetical protein
MVAVAGRSAEIDGSVTTWELHVLVGPSRWGGLPVGVRPVRVTRR